MVHLYSIPKRLHGKSRMSRKAHVRFCESRGMRFLRLLDTDHIQKYTLSRIEWIFINASLQGDRISESIFKIIY